MTVHFLRMEECTGGSYSLCCSRFIRGIGSLHRGSPPPPSLGIRGGKARGLIWLAVSAGNLGTASVGTVKEKSSRDVQSLPCKVGQKLFLGIYSAAPGFAEKFRDQQVWSHPRTSKNSCERWDKNFSWAYTRLLLVSQRRSETSGSEVIPGRAKTPTQGGTVTYPGCILDCSWFRREGQRPGGLKSSRDLSPLNANPLIF